LTDPITRASDAESIATSTSGSGAGGTAGNIHLTATTGQLDLSAAGILSVSNSTATNAFAAGTITLTAPKVVIENGSILSAAIAGGMSSTTKADITLNSSAGGGIELSDSTITTDSLNSASGGDITLNPNGSPVTLRDAQILASATSSGLGGDIQIGQALAGRTVPGQGAGYVVIEESQIRANAVEKNGGFIDINLEEGGAFVQDSSSIVNADSSLGNNGTVTINAPQVDLNSALRLPDVSVARKPELTANACRRDGKRSSFVREGRGGVSPAPDGYLSIYDARAGVDPSVVSSAAASLGAFGPLSSSDSSCR
jgi:hypothetical protein